MTLKEKWDILRDGGTASDGAFGQAFAPWVMGLIGTEGLEPFAPLAAMGETRLARLLERVCSGALVSVGGLPQLHLALLAALRHVAQGRRALLFSGMPASPAMVRSLTLPLVESLGITVEVTGHLFGHPKSALKKTLGADIVLCDYLQLLSALRTDPDLLKERPTAALVCEADLCLYDARIGIYDDRTLRAVGCIYHATGTQPWKEHTSTLDFAECAAAFERFGGMTSHLTKRVGKELQKGYAAALCGGIDVDPGKPFTTYTFHRAASKIDCLTNDISRAQEDCLVFYLDDPLRQAVSEQLCRRGQECVALANYRDLDTFLAQGGSSKRVGWYRGLPTLLRPPPALRLSFNVFIAQHYVMAHQHVKLRAFLEAALSVVGTPALYFSLEDDMFNIYAPEDGFQGAFDLIEFAEKYDDKRRVRRVMAASILRKVYRARRSVLREDVPILTLVEGGGGGLTSRRKGKTGKSRGERLEGLCFCGSGKPFRACHGRPRGT